MQRDENREDRCRTAPRYVRVDGLPWRTAIGHECPELKELSATPQQRHEGRAQLTQHLVGGIAHLRKAHVKLQVPALVAAEHGTEHLLLGGHSARGLELHCEVAADVRAPACARERESSRPSRYRRLGRLSMMRAVGWHAQLARALGGQESVQAGRTTCSRARRTGPRQQQQRRRE